MVTTNSASAISILENALPAKPRNTSVFDTSARYALDGDTHTGTDPIDPAVFTAVLTTLLACAVPAWRASRLEPVQALRTE